jgi:hypothetical protein
MLRNLAGQGHPGSSNAWRGILLASLVGIMVSGCVHSPEVKPPDADSRYGLGVDVPHFLPLPGPFREGAAILPVERFLIQGSQAVLDGCGASMSQDSLAESLAATGHLLTVWDIIRACAGNAVRSSGPRAIMAMAEGNEEVVMNELEADAGANLSVTLTAGIVTCTLRGGSAWAQAAGATTCQPGGAVGVTLLPFDYAATFHYLEGVHAG